MSSVVDIDNASNNLLINQENFIEYGMQRGFGDIHIKMCPKTGLQAIIAIHSTKLGPALGGCRFIEYPTPFAALYDAMRLARGMSYKAALVGLPLGGGKAVILKPSMAFDRKKYFESFGEFVESLGGRYITAIDSGTTLEDMDTIHSQTNYVASLSKQNGEPSKCTAHGVLRGIEAAVTIQLKRNTLDGVHVAVQGIGKVGFALAQLLHDQGARLTVSDVNAEACLKAKEMLGATVVDNALIHQVECDVFSPCALGGIINDKTIHDIKATIIAGAANNQLARAYHGHLLHEKGILYAPDYVINAGGLIYAASLYNKTEQKVANQQVSNIYNSMLTIFERARKDNTPCSVIADTIAQEKLN